MRFFWASVVLVASASIARAQTPGTQPLTLGDVEVAGSIRARSYSWDWFGSNAAGDYTYPASLMRLGMSQTHTSNDWQVEFALPIVVKLPTTAVMAAPQGQLGLGGAYFAANDNTASSAALFLKQGFFRWKSIAGVPGQSLMPAATACALATRSYSCVSRGTVSLACDSTSTRPREAGVHQPVAQGRSRTRRT